MINLTKIDTYNVCISFSESKGAHITTQADDHHLRKNRETESTRNGFLVPVIMTKRFLFDITLSLKNAKKFSFVVFVAGVFLPYVSFSLNKKPHKNMYQRLDI